ncbi:MAG TPA: membrane protein insertion efficiency factor YidD [Acholeplasmataceae bacterium]|jgi:putative membrane protein insertion efficiency factor|nr:membrane protein insertion efficiency factor YidD [Acholeplasmataceae bacterium]
MLNKLAIKIIKAYQKNKDIIGSGRCKHYPSCSNYGLECYQKFNFFKATWLTFYRIIRCNPFTKKVYDPVPLTKEEKRLMQMKSEDKK